MYLIKNGSSYLCHSGEYTDHRKEAVAFFSREEALKYRYVPDDRIVKYTPNKPKVKVVPFGYNWAIEINGKSIYFFGTKFDAEELAEQVKWSLST